MDIAHAARIGAAVGSNSVGELYAEGALASPSGDVTVVAVVEGPHPAQEDPWSGMARS